MLISAAAVGVALDAFRRINLNIAEFAARGAWYGGVLGAYAILALVMVFVFPGNPDSVPVPIDLLELFRTLSMAGQYLMWALLAAGISLVEMWYQRWEAARAEPQTPAAGLAG